jgi:hypothetical protein
VSIKKEKDSLSEIISAGWRASMMISRGGNNNEDSTLEE